MIKIPNNATGISADSREVRKGFTFVAIRGGKSDGHDFIGEAIKKGATVIVGEKDVHVPKTVKYFKVNDSREALGELASRFYGEPSSKLKVIGVTGTKGKTTTAHLIYHLLASAGKKAGLVSSIMAKIGTREIDTGFHVTTPDVISLQKLLAEMVRGGCEYAVLEVSSHAIDQKRVAGVNFEVGVLTNIAPEHLDYHKTFDEYQRIKLSFVNSARYKVIAPKETKINILSGDFNNLNAQAAVDAVALLGISKNEAIKGLHSFKLPMGRMEEIKTNKGFRVFVDFAHTPDSLEAALKYLRKITPGKLISVFGAAGERDPRKRTPMGEISSKIADLSIFTAEDTRTENIHDILDAIKKKAKNYKLIPERGEAIAFALSEAKDKDTVAFFGKGHEKSMAYLHFEHPWNEREMIEAQLSEKYGSVSTIVLAAGEGTRMKSPLPKVMHQICGRPLLAYTLENLRRVGLKDVVVVVKFKKEVIAKELSGAVTFVEQKIAKGGTADATKAGMLKVSYQAKHIVVMNGDDSAFYHAATIEDVINTHLKVRADLTFVSLEKSNPQGLGRVVRDAKGNLLGIIEEKDASAQQREIREVNDGLYVFEAEWLKKYLPKIKKSPITGEYYLVEIVKIALDAGAKVHVYKLKNSSEWQGINTPLELASAEEKMKERLAKYAA